MQWLIDVTDGLIAQWNSADKVRDPLQVPKSLQQRRGVPSEKHQSCAHVAEGKHEGYQVGAGGIARGACALERDLRLDRGDTGEHIYRTRRYDGPRRCQWKETDPRVRPPLPSTIPHTNVVCRISASPRSCRPYYCRRPRTRSLTRRSTGCARSALN